MKHSDYVVILEGLGKKAVSEALIKVALKHMPLFALGPWNYVLVKIANAIAGELVKQSEMAIFFKYVDFRTDSQAKDFEAAMLHNHKIQIMGTPEEKKDAEEKLIVALNALAALKS